jgi:hypothetical protein
MRTIPFRVVCLLGMNDGSFPRVRRPLSFDLIARKPVRGDRSQRDDDRYLFLEALLSARDRFLMTYVGQSITDNTPFPPSVVVSELLDTMGESFRIANEDSHDGEARVDAIVQRLVVRHPLQPFSPSYFRSDRDPRLFSFDRSQRNAAQAMCGLRRAAPEFVSRPLPEVDENEQRVVDVDDLIRFFQNPARFFLQRRLDIYLGRDADAVSDREPLELNSLDRWKIGMPLLDAVVEGKDMESLFPFLRADGQLPIGVLAAPNRSSHPGSGRLELQFQRPPGWHAGPPVREIQPEHAYRFEFVAFHGAFEAVPQFVELRRQRRVEGVCIVPLARRPLAVEQPGGDLREHRLGRHTGRDLPLAEVRDVPPARDEPVEPVPEAQARLDGVVVRQVVEREEIRVAAVALPGLRAVRPRTGEHGGAVGLPGETDL